MEPTPDYAAEIMGGAVADAVRAAVAAERARADAAEARLAALAAAVREERALTSRYEGAWAAHIANGAPLDAAEGVLALSDRSDAARATVDALLRGAPAPECSCCGEPAACFGNRGGSPMGYACGNCCRHDDEPGHCELVAEGPALGAT